LSGDWGNPDATFQLALENARYANVSFGSVRGTVDMRDGAFYFRPLRVYEADKSLSLEGMARFRPQRNQPLFDLAVAVHRFPLSRFLDYLDLKYPVDGLATASFPITGTPKEVTGGGRFELEEATLWGQKVPLLAGNLQFAPGRVALDDVSAQIGEGLVRGSGSVGIEDKTFQVRAAGDKIALSQIQAAESLGSDVAGKLSFQLSGNGSLERPDLKLTASLSEASFFGHSVPEASEPRVDVTLDHGVMSASVEVPSHWSLQANGDLFATPAKIGFKLDVPDLAALAVFTPLNLPPNEGGSFAFTGNLTLPEHPGEFPSGEGTVTRVQLGLLPDRRAVLSASEPIHVSLAEGKLTVQEFTATGEGTSVRLAGQVDLTSSPRAMSLSARGTMDASAVSILMPDLTLQGKITVDARAAGTFEQPILSGSLRMERGKYRLSGMGAVLDEVDATVTFHEARGDLNARAKYGGGEVQASGGFLVEGLSLKDFRVSLQARHVRLPTFQDLRIVADADLVATGGPSGNIVRGEVVLLRANYSRDFDITLSALMARSRPAGTTVVDPWMERTRIEIRIVSSESLEIRNNVARLTGTVDLIVRGTAADPTLLGQIVLDEGGRLTFRNVRYDIESGIVTFASARGFAPILDIHARAEVKGYDLGVGLVGTWPRIQASFTSDPPLPDESIFALLLTGSMGAATTTDLSGSIASVGAGIAAGAVTGGFTRGTQRVLRLERFEIDPIFSGGQLTDVRSTIGKQITPDILVTYSQSFETTKVPIVQVEWRISDSVILLAQKDENGIYRIDVRKRRRF
jgi:translocation and assembly module TamB